MKAVRIFIAIVLALVGIAAGTAIGAFLAFHMVGLQAMKENPIVQIVFQGGGVLVVAVPFLYLIGKVLPPPKGERKSSPEDTQPPFQPKE